MARKLILLPLLLLATLLLAASLAPAAPAPAPSVPFAFEEELEAEVEVDEEIGFESEAECIAEEAGFEAIELSEAELREICAEELEATEEAADSASRCPLRSANAHAATRNDRLKLTIGYTTNEPIGATFELKQGAARLATLQRHLGKSGVVRFSKQLDEQPNGRLSIRIQLQSGSAGCPSRRLVLFPR